MTNKERAILAVKALKEAYPNAECSLKYKDPVQMLISVRLSAQCTDARVNMVTPALFDRFPSTNDFANADPDEVGEYIKSCGLYKTKSKDIVEMCKIINEKFNGEVPDSIEELVKLPGVGRKTANLIVGDIYGQPAVVVDTHFTRVTKRLGFHNTKNPVKIEKIMRDLLPPEESNKFCHRTVIHGREVCDSRKPLCSKCVMKGFCEYCILQKPNISI